jgi:hypothetical protein
MLLMIRPHPSSKVLLVADHRAAASAEPGSVPMRRYRLARLRLDGRPVNRASRFEHLKCVYD